MRALFDVNVLIAIVDEKHEHHWKAHEWWAANRSAGWATCPLTENGMVRIMSQSGYKSPVTATFAIDFLVEQIGDTDHAFWPDATMPGSMPVESSGQIRSPTPICWR